MKLILNFFLCAFPFGIAISQNIDVKKYTIYIELNDETDEIWVKEIINFDRMNEEKKVVFDFVNLKSNGKGMVVDTVHQNNEYREFEHRNDSLFINIEKNDINQDLTIYYHGIPNDGLIIGQNKFGDRTFFGDNWPNRAHNWFACVDHPSDKALVEYFVTVPLKYQVIANGALSAVDTVFGIKKLFHYNSLHELPTKVMVIGVADFKTKEFESVNKTPVSGWVYKNQASKALYDLELAPQVLNFFIDYIGPYPYEKLANVQSTTRYGGMENAGCIFYDEDALNGNRTSEDLIAHEIAHQWFGNSATEVDWEHIWLSEGFATYFANLYIEEFKGTKAFNSQMDSDRQRVISFNKNFKSPLVDINYQDLEDLLNPNSYQKGGWILHMLRNQIGDSLFKNAIRNYYELYKFGNASTDNLKDVFETTTGASLTEFFDQWVYGVGHPKLQVESKISNTKVVFEIKQIGKKFNFPLTIRLNMMNGTKEDVTLNVSDQKQTFTFQTSAKVKSYDLDPDVNLLFEKVK